MLSWGLPGRGSPLWGLRSLSGLACPLGMLMTFIRLPTSPRCLLGCRLTTVTGCPGCGPSVPGWLSVGAVGPLLLVRRSSGLTGTSCGRPRLGLFSCTCTGSPLTCGRGSPPGPSTSCPSPLCSRSLTRSSRSGTGKPGSSWIFGFPSPSLSTRFSELLQLVDDRQDAQHAEQAHRPEQYGHSARSDLDGVR